MRYISKKIKIACMLLLVVVFYQTKRRSSIKTTVLPTSKALLEASFREKLDHYETIPFWEHEGNICEKVTFYAQKNRDSLDPLPRIGLLVRRPRAKGTVLICHGYMCDKFDVSFIRTFFKNYHVFSFDFRAHGDCNEHEQCTMGHDEPLDVAAAVRFIKQHPDLKDTPLFGYGFSMGAVSLIEAQAQNPTFKALILDCPFESTQAILQRGLSGLRISLLGYEFDIPGKSLLERYGMHPYMQPFMKLLLKAISTMDGTQIRTSMQQVCPAESIKSIDVPCFFIHCKNDEKVPPEAIQTIYDNACGYKKMWITPGRRHFDSIFYNPEKYCSLANAFLKDVRRGKIKQLKSGTVMDDTKLKGQS